MVPYDLAMMITRPPDRPSRLGGGGVVGFRDYGAARHDVCDSACRGRTSLLAMATTYSPLRRSKISER